MKLTKCRRAAIPTISMFCFLAFIVMIGTFVLLAFPEFCKGPFHHFFLLGAAFWFALARWMKELWSRRMSEISRKYGDPYEVIKAL
jgi:hypothetical protein